MIVFLGFPLGFLCFLWVFLRLSLGFHSSFLVRSLWFPMRSFWGVGNLPLDLNPTTFRRAHLYCFPLSPHAFYFIGGPRGRGGGQGVTTGDRGLPNRDPRKQPPALENTDLKLYPLFKKQSDRSPLRSQPKTLS